MNDTADKVFRQSKPVLFPISHINRAYIRAKAGVLQPFFAIMLCASALCAQEGRDEILRSVNLNDLKEIKPLPTPAPAPVSSEEEASSAAAQKFRFAQTRKILLECRMMDFSEADYNKAVSALFREFETAAGKKIARGPKGKVGIKVYSNSGAGLGTPVALVNAVISQLERRGYKRGEVTIIDLNRRKLRDTGFLPRVGEVAAGAPDDFAGSPVADLESGKYYDKAWFYDNPLPPKSSRYAQYGETIFEHERKSMIPVPLYYGFDFWINLPVVTDIDGLGVSGAIANVSLWNISNHERFLKNPQNSLVAATEITAIPEMRDGYLFTIMSFEKMQVVGGSIFNSGATFREPFIFLSPDIVALDYIALEFMNRHRAARGFDRIFPDPQIFDNCEQLGLGDREMNKHERVFVPYK